jgi:4-amino-4-deoxy-L-arabinose transferase-like glycosyltransferase
LHLPQALAGVLSVVVLYFLVRQSFGPVVALIAALVLTLTPISVAANRNNTMDSLLVLTSLLAAWAMLRAVASGRISWLFVSMALVGVGFNIKMLQAFMILPSLCGLYIVAGPHRLPKRVLNLAAAGILLAVVSLSWAVAVDLTPADQRPYVGSSRDNTALQLILGHNGVERLGDIARWLGLDSGRPRPAAPGRYPTGPGALVAPGQPPTLQPGGGPAPPGAAGAPPPGAGAGAGFSWETGEVGNLRLFNRQLAGQASWLLPLAAAGLGGGLVLARLRRLPRAQQQALVLWAGWLAPQVVFFSYAGLFHRYYLEMLAPAIAAGVAAGIAVAWAEYRRGGPAALFLPAALAGSAIGEALILSDFPDWHRWLTPLVMGLAIAAAVALIALRLYRADQRWMVGATGIGLGALLLAPAAWIGITISHGGDPGLPFAGPDLAMRQPGRPSGSSPYVGRLDDFLLAESGDTRFLVGTVNANTAAPLILATGRPVMALGGFSGGDRILDTEKLAALVAADEVRFFLLPQAPVPGTQVGAPPGAGQQGALTRWVSDNCDLVSERLWQSGVGAPGRPGPGGSNRLYDCRD